VNRIRDELNSSYLKLRGDKAEMPLMSNTASIQIKESELLRSLRELSISHPEYVALQTISQGGLEQLRSAIPAGTTVLEYFNSANEIIAFIVSREDARIVRHLCPLARIRYIENQLRNHFRKVAVAMRKSHVAPHPDFANSLLQEMYQHLLEPIVDQIGTPRLTVVPHGLLHFVPFAALFDGDRYLQNRFQISYLHRASVLSRTVNRKPVSGAWPVVMGRPDDEGDPEYGAIREAAPDADWVTGMAFTRDSLEIGRRAEFVHIAADVVFRHDNPMFTSIRCQDSMVNSIDFYSLRCETNLLTLSGNVSGLNPAAGCDSVVGLIEGLLYSGARSILMNMWNVDLKTRGEFMRAFYGAWRSGSSAAVALQEAAAAVSISRPHPFFWAPYILIGD
jgi:CHAT domain-containing protein